ncbi:sulfotransferase family protein [Marivita geojedonensis]|uniref:Sulfotransferase family protein n=1 Tax=Marivita geojedonensis TaxID=1123756 RepID=A0A1X4NIG4_9RHOB|nr:sulfotransferase family protein [Marivita geojedonensis]OSQ48245.1 hypothetical protein MGEO_15160 [Marivita geojedonensis]PRY74875.1 hypothetical protein CLV76_11712 [Marivita geojedonensis]
MPLKIIGTGFGRTGTDSMRHALNILGVGPTHHMFELEEGTPLRPLWLDLAKGGTPDWEKLFEGYSACVDWPSAYYWRTLIDVYPEAKVILTMRSAESWWDSFEKTLLRYLQTGDDPNGLAHLLVANQVFHGRASDRDHAIAVYNKNVEDVLATVSPDRLLVHNLGDGWQPLCKWLDVPIPNIDYPSGNTTKDLHEKMAAKGVDLS